MSYVSTHRPWVRFEYRHESRARLALWCNVSAAQDLDGRACQHGVVEPDVWLGDLHLYGFDSWMVVKRAGGDPLRQGLDELDGRAFNDGACHTVNLTVVHGLRQVVCGPSGPQVEVQCDAHDERLAPYSAGRVPWRP
jgi:hypothetical protein